MDFSNGEGKCVPPVLKFYKKEQASLRRNCNLTQFDSWRRSFGRSPFAFHYPASKVHGIGADIYNGPNQLIYVLYTSEYFCKDVFYGQGNFLKKFKC